MNTETWVNNYVKGMTEMYFLAYYPPPKYDYEHNLSLECFMAITCLIFEGVL
jgi:hypothetical protein